MTAKKEKGGRGSSLKCAGSHMHQPTDQNFRLGDLDLDGSDGNDSVQVSNHSMLTDES